MVLRIVERVDPSVAHLYPHKIGGTYQVCVAYCESEYVLGPIRRVTYNFSKHSERLWRLWRGLPGGIHSNTECDGPSPESILFVCDREADDEE